MESNPKVLFDDDCSLQYYIRLSRKLPDLRGILYVMLISSHYILFEHSYKDNKITEHNSLSQLDGITDAYASYDVTNQHMM